MTKNTDIFILTIIFLTLLSSITIALANESTPPNSISGLRMISRGEYYIDWGWTDPTTADFDHVDVYINGVFKANVLKGVKHYKATGLTPSTSYKISTHTVDSYGNINQTWVSSTRTTKTPSLGTIRFITVGDPHITSNTSSDQYKRLTKVVNYINSRSDIDFTVIMGDIADTASSNNYMVAKALLDELNKPYYTVKGNHDGPSSTTFEKYFGSSKRIVSTNGYQLIFVGISVGVNNTEHWSFDYSTADKSKPTVIFNHGPVQPDKGGTSCIGSWGDYYGYACDMRPEVDSFSRLLGYYNGHVHSEDHQTINGALFASADNIGGNGADSDYIGYTQIKNGALGYALINYMTPPNNTPTPTPITPVPTTPTPTATTPVPTTPIPTATTPVPTTPIPTATTPVPTTPIPTVTTPIPTTTTPSGGGGSGGSGGGSGGGGGGGGASPEPYSNILKYESKEEYIGMNPTTFRYATPELAVYEVTIIGKSSDDVTLRVEVLKDTSKLVSEPAPGVVYKNLNLWANSKKIKNATIRYKVKSDTPDMKMLKWDNTTKKWVELPTKIISKDDSYTYLESNTEEFSTFAISRVKNDDTTAGNKSPTNTVTVPTDVGQTEDKPVDDKEQNTDDKGQNIPGFEIMLPIISILLIAYLHRRIDR